MKMKKAYAAALAAALMVTTAGFSVSADNLTSTGTTDLGDWGNFKTTVTASGEDVAKSLNGQTLTNVTVDGYATEGYVDDKVGAVQRQLNDVAADAGMAANWVRDNAADLENKITDNTDNIADLQTTVEQVKKTADGAYTLAGETHDKVNQHIDKDGNISGTNGTFTGTVSGKIGDFNAINAGNSLVGGVGLENGHIIAEDGIYAGNGSQFHVDANGNMTTEGNVEGTLIKGDYGMFGNTAISANEGIVMNKVTEAADGSTTNEEVFKVDKDGNVSTNGAMSVAQGANINGGLAVNGGAAINGGLTVDGTDVMGSIADNADKIAQNTTAIANNSSRINALNSRVSDLGNEIDNVGAISAALAGLHPLDYDGTGSKFQLAAAMGSYDGSQAAAIGGFYHFNEDVMMSVGGATAFDGDNKSAFNVGVSFRIGQGSSGKKVNSDDVLAQLNAMNEKIAALEAENQQLSEKVAALEGGEGAEAAEAE